MDTKKTKVKVIPESENRFKIVGNLVSIDGDMAVLETNTVSMITGKGYNDQYPIEVDQDLATKLQPLVGTTVGIIGYVEHKTGSIVSYLRALEVKPLPNAIHMNRLKFTGPVYGADLFSRTEDKRQMGNVTFVIASRTLNAVTWRGAVTELRHEKVKRDSVVTLKGRARLREFESQGSVYKTIELTCDQSADVEVHYVPDESDEFSFDGTSAQAGAPAAMADGPKPKKYGSKRNAV